MKTRQWFTITLIGIIFLSITSCSGDKKNKAPKVKPISAKAAEPKAIDPMKDMGIGPVKELTLPAEIDQKMAAEGKKIYKEKCSACHKPDKKFIGPAPKGILERRTPAWVMNMILNPDVMIKKNKIAKDLLMKFNGSPMANQNLTEEQARKVLEYFRTL